MPCRMLFSQVLLALKDFQEDSRFYTWLGAHRGKRSVDALAEAPAQSVLAGRAD